MDSAEVGTDGTEEGRDSVEVGTGPERPTTSHCLMGQDKVREELTGRRGSRCSFGPQILDRQ
jgi:hypothetical protein